MNENKVFKKFAITQVIDTNNPSRNLYGVNAIQGRRKSEKYWMGMFTFDKEQTAKDMVSELNEICPILPANLASDERYKDIAKKYKPLCIGYNATKKHVLSSASIKEPK